MSFPEFVAGVYRNHRNTYDKGDSLNLTVDDMREKFYQLTSAAQSAWFRMGVAHTGKLPPDEDGIYASDFEITACVIHRAIHWYGWTDGRTASRFDYVIGDRVRVLPGYWVDPMDGDDPDWTPDPGFVAEINSQPILGIVVDILDHFKPVRYVVELDEIHSHLAYGDPWVTAEYLEKQ